jgi:hypothetical protein
VGTVADTRTCDQCGTAFVPRREHARFCCVRCRAAWNRAHTGIGQGRITSWTWKPVPGPALASLASRGRSWELTRHRAYQAHLADHTLGETFGRTAAFLNLTAAGALSITVKDAHAGR